MHSKYFMGKIYDGKQYETTWKLSKLALLGMFDTSETNERTN